MLKSRHVVIIAACAALFSAFPVSAQTKVIYGCVDSKSGSLRIVSAATDCTTKESKIHWNDGGSSLVWVDANGSIVGPAHGDQYAYATVDGFQLNLKIVPEKVGLDSLALSNRASVGYRKPLYFEQQGCSGQAYLSTDGSTIPGDERFVTEAVWLQGGPRIYVGRMEEPVVRIPASYYPSQNGLCVNLSPNPGGLSIPADATAVDLNTLFPPPLRLEWQ